jgi:hypothetical protein
MYPRSADWASSRVTPNPNRCSVLLVQEPGAKLRSVAEDLYARALDRALDDVLRAVRSGEALALDEQPGGFGAAERDAPAPALVPVLVPASSALLRQVLLDEAE